MAACLHVRRQEVQSLLLEWLLWDVFFCVMSYP